jgi:hypothetical protein
VIELTLTSVWLKPVGEPDQWMLARTPPQSGRIYFFAMDRTFIDRLASEFRPSEGEGNSAGWGGMWAQSIAVGEVILNYVEFDMSSEEAFKAPRYSTTHFISSFGQDRASLGSLSVPNTLPETVQADLRARGHVVTASRGGVGGVALIGIDPKTKQAIAVGPAAGKME